jgi:microsomal epoxide hydrolase
VPTIEPFTIDIPNDALDDLERRLHATRWPDQMPSQEWVYGAERSEVQAIVEYWANVYDWRQAEAAINAHPQFITTIQGERVHFLHVRSTHTDATPLLLTHGWPGSIVEFLHVIEPLTDPTDGSRPFHLVIPSLPGFGFSGPTVTPGVDPRRIATMWAELMATLGYDRYVAQGGDWGAIITGHLGEVDAEHCIGIHLNMVPARPTAELMANATDAEKEAVAATRHFQAEETGYQAIQGTKPQTLAYALTDSPAGLCAWIYEKFHTWSDRAGGDVFSTHDRDRFCTNVMLYWLTNTAGSAARIYYEHLHLGARQAKDVSVPMAGAIFPAEIYRTSRRFAAEVFNVVHWSEFDAGGHFAALEQPEALITDLRSFVDQILS